MKNHWKYDRNDKVLKRFADYTVDKAGAMKMWLGLDEAADPIEDNLCLAFECLDTSVQVEMLENFIVEAGMVGDFNDWYEAMFGGDEEDDEYDHYHRDEEEGERIDEAYDRYMD